MYPGTKVKWQEETKKRNKEYKTKSIVKINNTSNIKRSETKVDEEH